MDYEFQNIEELVRKVIDKGIESPQVQITIAAERHRIIKTFVLKVYSIEITYAERYLRYHQQVLINLLDELFNASLASGKSTGRASSFIDSIGLVSTELQNILEFIQTRFPNYFDLECQAPKYITDKAIKSLMESSSILEKELLKFEIDPALLSICWTVIENCLKSVDHQITYQRMIYTKEFSTQLMTLIESSRNKTTLNTEIWSLLMYLNFNQPRYLKYHIDLIQHELLSIETLSGKLEQLSFHLKEVNQSETKRGLAFDTGLRSLKEQLTDWILEEINFYQQKYLLNSVSTNTDEKMMEKDFKLVLHMSVSQFAYFIRTLTEIDVIQNKNVTQVIRFLSKFVKTKRSENISYESFRIKYYNTEHNAKIVVKDLFHSSINFINKNLTQTL
jgi:hypothetical protein